MIAGSLLLALAVSGGLGHGRDAGWLPVCSNRLVNEVVKRAGCTVGDGRCWVRGGGSCSDWIQKRIRAERAAEGVPLDRIDPAEVRQGDVALFASRVHYAYVEHVVKDGNGRPVAVDVSEYNFGKCWVDREAMITDQYGIVSRRRAIALSSVDGGFLRPRTSAR